MCETCGCGNKGFTVHDPMSEKDGRHYTNEHDHTHSPHSHEHSHGDGHLHTHSHDHSHHHDHDDHHHDHTHDTVLKQVDLGIDILSSNNITAAMNRKFFEGRMVFCLNLVSSPGSGKTALLERTIADNPFQGKIYVIEGDQQTQLDAERIAKAGAKALQINTGSGCHLDAKMIESAIGKLKPGQGSVLFIENVGNLVCPALFDLGEHKRVLIISVTEGADKPLKYPDMFSSSNLCLINKSDLLPYVDFSVEDLMRNARQIKPDLEFITLSARTGDGLQSWFEWLIDQSKRVTD